jgi:hypothetical protein
MVWPVSADEPTDGRKDGDCFKVGITAQSEKALRMRVV